VGGWRFEHTYAGLPALFHSAAAPTPVRDPQFVVFNPALAVTLGLDVAALDTPAGAAIFAGNTLPEGARPLAQAYAGHQFGHFTGLGDGRAILLGEQVTPDGSRVDVQLKGAGQTPYSRRGDGRAALGPMLRELVISEAMHALGIPTSRSLAVVSTGEPVQRERVLPGAVLTRIAASHLRVGTFEWAAAHRDPAALSALVHYAIRRHDPAAAAAAAPALALFDAVAERQAALIARWQLVGFIHGVMNTDNMAISGETIDYGPCAFMDVYDPDTVFSSIDHQGRYAYANQPPIAQWNLARLAEALLPMFADDQAVAIEHANAALERFTTRFRHHWLAGMRGKLGLATAEDDDVALAEALLAWMHETRADFTNTFRALSAPDGADAALPGDPGFAAWHAQWQARLAREASDPDARVARMQRHNPAIIPRNHTVEAALTAAADDGDLAPLERLLAALATPFDHVRVPAEFAAPADPGARPYRTFCGT
jgi:serine/tyrosine/threonine adenylyltransferase